MGEIGFWDNDFATHRAWREECFKTDAERRRDYNCAMARAELVATRSVEYITLEDIHRLLEKVNQQAEREGLHPDHHVCNQGEYEWFCLLIEEMVRWREESVEAVLESYGIRVIGMRDFEIRILQDLVNEKRITKNGGV